VAKAKERLRTYVAETRDASSKFANDLLRELGSPGQGRWVFSNPIGPETGIQICKTLSLVFRLACSILRPTGAVSGGSGDGDCPGRYPLNRISWIPTRPCSPGREDA
jgi:hypothetical protein